MALSLLSGDRNREAVLTLSLNILTAIQLVSYDNEESNAGPKCVDSDGYFTQDTGDFTASGSNNLLIRALIADLKKPNKMSKCQLDKKVIVQFL